MGSLKAQLNPKIVVQIAGLLGEHHVVLALFQHVGRGGHDLVELRVQLLTVGLFVVLGVLLQRLGVGGGVPVGMKVWAEAELTAVDGRKITFAVTAFDDAGPIGKGVHQRFVIQNEKFLAKAQAKKGAD